MPYNKALLAKLDKQNAERTAKALMESADYARFQKDKVYERRRATDGKFLGFVTLRGFVKMMGCKATQGVYRQYTLHEVTQ